MSHIIHIDSTSWYICYDLSKDKLHFGMVNKNSVINTGQPNYELFASEDLMAKRLDELKGVNGWYNANKPIEDDPLNPPPAPY